MFAHWKYTFNLIFFKVNTYIAVRNWNHLTATGNHVPHGITQCYLSPGSGDFPACTPAEAGTRFSGPGRMQGWVDLSWLQLKRFIVKCQSWARLFLSHTVSQGSILLLRMMTMCVVSPDDNVEQLSSKQQSVWDEVWTDATASMSVCLSVCVKSLI